MSKNLSPKPLVGPRPSEKPADKADDRGDSEGRIVEPGEPSPQALQRADSRGVMGIGSNNVYRLIAIDFDGTLLSPKGVVTARTRDALHAVAATGCKVCFATGRNFTESHAIIAAAGLSGIGVFVGGAMTMTVPSGNVIHRMAMRPDLARQVSATLEQMGHPVLAMQDHSAEGIDYLVSHDIPLTKCSQDWMDCVSARVLRIKDLGAAPHDHTLRVGAVADTPAALVARDALQKLFGDRIVTQVIAVNAGLTVLEVFDPAVNKWAAISRLAAEQGIGPGQIIAVGDEVNDLPMVRAAGLGVAMGNAVPELKAIAARVIASNADDGLAQFIQELLRQNQLAGEPSSTGNASLGQMTSGQLAPGKVAADKTSAAHATAATASATQPSPGSATLA